MWQNLSVLTPPTLIISHITAATAANNVSSCLPAALFQLTYLLELLPSSFGPLLLFSTLLLLAGDLNKANNTAYTVNAIYNKKLRRWPRNSCGVAARHPCISYVGHGRSEANKQSIDSKCGATGDNYPAHSSRGYSKEFFGVHNFKSSCMM